MTLKNGIASRPRPTTGGLRVGFVPLLDAAPLIVARELGYFADEGLDVALERQIGWGNVRDKLTFGQLDASHALLGMPLASQLGWSWYVEPLVSLMTLSTGGNAITISGRLADRGVRNAEGVKQWLVGGRREDAPLVAHVASCSTHHYLLRRWLSDAGIDVERDVRLCIVPPPQMASQLQGGTLDAFCVGEPWNTLAAKTARGRIVARTTDLVPNHPEKVLAVTRKWLAQNADVAERLVRACIRGCRYVADPAHRNDVARLLAGRCYLGLSEELLRASLAFVAAGARPAADHAPSTAHMAWLLGEMISAGHAPDDTDVTVIAQRCADTIAYRGAAESLGLPCPDTGAAPMRVRQRTHDPLASHDPPRRSPATAAAAALP